MIVIKQAFPGAPKRKTSRNSDSGNEQKLDGNSTDRIELSGSSHIGRGIRAGAKSLSGLATALAMTPVILGASAASATEQTEAPDGLLLGASALMGAGCVFGAQLTLAAVGAAALAIPVIGAGLLCYTAVTYPQPTREPSAAFRAISNTAGKIRDSVVESYSNGMQEAYNEHGRHYLPGAESLTAGRAFVQGVKTGLEASLKLGSG